MTNFIYEPNPKKSGNKLIDWFNDHAMKNSDTTTHNPFIKFIKEIFSSSK